TGFATCSIKESAADSDADLDVDGDDTLEYGKAQYTEADIIPCSGAGEDQGEAREREALRGAVLKYEVLSTTLAQILYSLHHEEHPWELVHADGCPTLLQRRDAFQQNNARVLQVGKRW
ncbi:hypothetical protein GOODEAATRI_002275, partial [Goodea atripinnis]